MLSQFIEVAGEVNFLNIYKARNTVYQYLKKTHLIHYANLSDLIGTRIYIKHENHNPTGSFKIRGSVNYMANIPEELKESGIIVATRGNHGLAVAWAAKQVGVLCSVVVPHGNNPETNRSIQGLGAQLIEQGNDFYEAKRYCEDMADQLGYYYLKQGNEPHLLNGLGTMGLEIFEDLPDVDVIIIPIGGGSGAASLIRVVQAINQKVQVIGVIAEKAPALALSLKENKRVITESADTFADGMAARSIFEVPYLIIKDYLSEVVMVSEEEIIEGVRLSLALTHNLAEGAGAASIAGALKIKESLKDKKVVLLMTGANLDRQHLLWALEERH